MAAVYTDDGRLPAQRMTPDMPRQADDAAEIRYWRERAIEAERRLADICARIATLAGRV